MAEEKYKNIDINRFSQFWFKFLLYTYQLSFLKACLTKNRVVAIWPRQSGKSQTVSVYCLFRALLDKIQIIIVAPTQSQSGELYLKIRAMAEENEVIKSQITKSTETEMIFLNGSRILSLPCGPEGKSIRGYTADIVVLEEAGIMKDSIVNTVILPMIAAKKDKGQIIKIGTPLLKNNFYESCFNKKYEVIKITWRDCVEVGQYSLDFIEEQKSNLLANEFLTEYEAEFPDDSMSFFTQELINKCIDQFTLWKD